MQSLILLAFFGFITFSLMAGTEYPVQGQTFEVKTYKLDNQYKSAILNMGYASATIQNPEIWKSKNKIPVSVDIVFTAYPRKKEDWITNYDFLLQKRIESVLKLEPELQKRNNIKWNFILQTQCQTEKEAERMFHGAVIKFLSLTPEPIKIKKEGEQATEDITSIYNEIETGVYGFTPFPDSVVLKTFGRNSWGKMLVVTDWTGSMYPYGSQVVLWHRLNFEKDLVKYFIFFNDGNQKLDRQKRVGNTGGIYYARPDSLEYLLKVMKFDAKRGSGGDIPENNIEALLKAIRIFKGYDELVMIADNNAGVRDMALLPRVTAPVRVILCGLNTDQPIHPHYLEIARQTGGSVHTLEEDILNLKDLKEGQKIVIEENEYLIKRGKMVFRKKVIPKISSP